MFWLYFFLLARWILYDAPVIFFILRIFLFYDLFIYIPYENVHFSICFHTPLLLWDFIFKIKKKFIWKA